MNRVRIIITDCRESHEIMSLSDFKHCLDAIYYHLKKAAAYEDGSSQSQKHMKIADGVCEAVSDCFIDRNDNLVNWFHGEPCKFHHPLTGNDIEVKVRDDYEAIYNFLCYCAKLNQHQPIEDDFFAYLAYILCEPVC